MFINLKLNISISFSKFFNWWVLKKGDKNNVSLIDNHYKDDFGRQKSRHVVYIQNIRKTFFFLRNMAQDKQVEFTKGVSKLT